MDRDGRRGGEGVIGRVVEIEGVERKRNRDTEEVMEGEGEGVRGEEGYRGSGEEE